MTGVVQNIVNRRYVEGVDQPFKEQISGVRLQIGEEVYQVEKNKDADKSTLQRVTQYVRDNAFRVFQVAGKGGNVAIEACRLAGREVPQGVVKATSLANKAWPLFSFTVLPESSREAVEAVKEAYSNTQGSSEEQLRRVGEAVQKTCGAFAAAGYSFSTVAACIPGGEVMSTQLKNVADVFDAGENSSSLAMRVQDWSKAHNRILLARENKADSRQETIFVEKKRLSLLQILKAVCSIAGFIFGVSFLVTGAALVPPIAALTISLASTLFAVSASLYEKSLHHPLDFFKHREVVHAKVA